MIMNEYQQLAEVTANRTTADTDQKRYTNYAMGLSGEAGEVTDLLKKVVFHGHDLDKDKLKKELGDVMWYVAMLASTAGIELNEIASANIEKLRQRYPEGFNVIDSKRRADLIAERDNMLHAGISPTDEERTEWNKYGVRG
ncbi:nucleoside triphosphate pyrophosphohydrolase family protein [Paenibacillus typhae]|nr:nucleoside triphosphate pyrophosphohydrolase family protein [Paenibacillus typhae]